MTNRIVAPCGIVCNACQAYLATQSNDSEKLQEVAELWSSEDEQYEANDLICDGCFSNRLHVYCAQCEVRNCALEKGLSLCSLCSLYPCDRLNDAWSSFSNWSIDELKITLEEEKQRTLSQTRA